MINTHTILSNAYTECNDRLIRFNKPVSNKLRLVLDNCHLERYFTRINGDERLDPRLKAESEDLDCCNYGATTMQNRRKLYYKFTTKITLTGSTKFYEW